MERSSGRTSCWLWVSHEPERGHSCPPDGEQHLADGNVHAPMPTQSAPSRLLPRSTMKMRSMTAKWLSLVAFVPILGWASATNAADILDTVTHPQPGVTKRY